ncbi:MAG: S9 family peptidase [Acidobacteria bacterium]|nr:S9 family peptidase [Acidobacteriota bacterium]
MRLSLRAVLLSFILLSTFSMMVTAADEKFPSNEDLRHYRSMRTPRLSPDGHRVIVAVGDSAADGGKQHVWLVDIDSNSYRQITFSPSDAKNPRDRGETSAAWMPDGQSVLFLAHRGEHTQLYRLPLAGGEASAFDLKVVPPVDSSKLPEALPPAPEKNKGESKPPEPLPIDVSGFTVAPDGKTIALWAADPQTPGEKSAQEAKGDAVWVNHSPHGTRLYLLDPNTGKLATAGVAPDVNHAEFTDDSAELVVECESPNDESDLGPASSAWFLTLSDPQHPRKLALPLDARGLTWSRDGQHLYFFSKTKSDAPPGVSDVYEFTIGNSQIRNFTDGYTGSIAGETPVLDQNGTLIQLVANGVNTGLARIDPAQPKVAPIPMPTPVTRNPATNARRTGWVFLGESSTQPTTLYFTSDLNSPARVLSTPALTPSVRAVASRLVEWNNEGRNLQGLLYLPPEASQRRVPLIVDVHGGPTGVFVDSYAQFLSFLAGHGWAVLRPNPRGSTGRGAAFAAANKNDLGGGDYRDIMAGVDYVLKRFSLDPDKMALMGYSYGGEMAGFVEGKTNRFKAIICGAPVIDQFSEYGTERGSWYDRWFYGKPWDHFADAWRQSPISGLAHASTPFLLLQGQADTTDPPGQSEEMYRALRQMGVPVDLVEYPRDNHGPLAQAIFGEPTSEPWHGFDARQRIVKMLEKAFGEQSASSSNP